MCIRDRNSIGREKMGAYTLIMIMIFLLIALLVAIFWIVLRYCLRQKFKKQYYNRDFADEEYLKYYKEIPQMVYKMGQIAESAEDIQTKTQTNKLPEIVEPKTSTRQQIYMGSTGNNSINTPKVNKFQIQNTNKPDDLILPVTNMGMRPDAGDIIEKNMNFISEENNEINYNPKRSRAPHQFRDPNEDKKIAKITLKNLEENPYYQKDNYQTTDRSANIISDNNDSNKLEIKVKESELFHSYDFVHQNNNPSNNVNDPISFEPKEVPQIQIQDNMQYSPSGTYLLDNDVRKNQSAKNERNVIQQTHHINYSYSQFGTTTPKTENYSSNDAVKKIEESTPGLMVPDLSLIHI